MTAQRSHGTSLRTSVDQAASAADQEEEDSLRRRRTDRDDGGHQVAHERVNNPLSSRARSDPLNIAHDETQTLPSAPSANKVALNESLWRESSAADREVEPLVDRVSTQRSRNTDVHDSVEFSASAIEPDGLAPRQRRADSQQQTNQVMVT
jgi:hypothetical protein